MTSAAGSSPTARAFDASVEIAAPANNGLVFLIGAADTLDGAGLKLVIGLAKSCIQQNRKLTIQTSNPVLRASLQFCGLDRLIDMQEA